MREFSFRGLIFMVFIAFLVWSSNFEACIARRGKHWRQNRDVSASLYKKKGKSHGNKYNNHHGGGSHSKPKPPSSPPQPKAPPHYKFTPSPSASPPPPPPPIPKPKKGTPSLHHQKVTMWVVVPPSMS